MTAATRAPYRAANVGRVRLVARPALWDALANRLSRFGTLYDWAAAEPQPRALQGRGVVYVAELAAEAATMAVRHSWHGGLLAPLTGDRFLMPTRAPREAAVSALLRDHGVPTPDVLAYALYPAGPGLRRVDVATRYVPDAWDLGTVLAERAPGITRSAALHAAVQLLGKLAGARASHPDLNVKNILLVQAKKRTLEAWVLDVDVVRFRSTSPPAVMAANLARLVRSMKKWRTRGDITLSDDELQHVAAAALAATPAARSGEYST